MEGAKQEEEGRDLHAHIITKLHVHICTHKVIHLLVKRCSIKLLISMWCMEIFYQQAYLQTLRSHLPSFLANKRNVGWPNSENIVVHPVSHHKVHLCHL